MIGDYETGVRKPFLDSASDEDIPFFTGYAFSKDETKILLESEVERIYRRSKEAIYWVYDMNTETASKVFNEKIQEPLFSPDGSKVAYVFQRDLYVKDLETGDVVAITTDGDFETLNGITDWVYEEEFGFVRAFDWNADSNRIAFMRFDESEVPIFSMDVYGSDLYPFPYMFRYPKAGEANAKISLHLYDLNAKQVTDLKFFGEEAPYYIPRMEFAEGNSLMVQTTNRHQNHLKVWRFDVVSRMAKVLWEEQDKAYVSVHDNLTFLPDNSFSVD